MFARVIKKKRSFFDNLFQKQNTGERENMSSTPPSSSEFKYSPAYWKQWTENRKEAFIASYSTDSSASLNDESNRNFSSSSSKKKKKKKSISSSNSRQSFIDIKERYPKEKLGIGILSTKRKIRSTTFQPDQKYEYELKNAAYINSNEDLLSELKSTKEKKQQHKQRDVYIDTNPKQGISFTQASRRSDRGNNAATGPTTYFTTPKSFGSHHDALSALSTKGKRSEHEFSKSKQLSSFKSTRTPGAIYNPEFNAIRAKAVDQTTRFGQEERNGNVSSGTTTSSIPGPKYTLPSSFENTSSSRFASLPFNKSKSSNVLETRLYENEIDFGYGCNLEEHIQYGQCLDGKCLKRGSWEKSVALLQVGEYSII